MRRGRWLWAMLGVAGAVALGGCESDAPSLAVDLRTDLVPAREVVTVRAELTRDSRPGVVLREERTIAASEDALGGVRVAEWGELDPGTWRVRLELFDGAARRTGAGQVIVDLGSSGQGVTVVVTRDCAGVVCDPSQTCVDMACVDSRCAPESLDACPMGCESDSDCSTSGPSCVVGRCVDQVCFEAADDGACGAGTCDPSTGCVGSPSDAGAMDAGAPDAGGPAPLFGVTAIAAGYDHTCAILAGGEIACWGANTDGQLGDGTTTNRVTAARVIGVDDAAQLALGRRHGCVRRAGGQVACWGGARFGQLGDGTLDDSDTPVEVMGLSNATEIAAGWDHTCAVVPGDAGRCWGRGDRGQRFDGTTLVERPSPAAVSGVPDVAGVAGGQIFACIWSTNSQVHCTGNNFYGQLGSGMTGSVTTPQRVLSLASPIQMALGFGHSCARTASGITCWGLNEDGQLGDGTLDDRASPGPFVISSATDLEVGSRHSCAVAAGTVLCWGNNEGGQLGDGTMTNRSSPTPVPDLSGVRQVAAGDRHTCALTTGGEVLCWGDNDAGQLGDGTREQRSTPALVLE